MRECARGAANCWRRKAFLFVEDLLVLEQVLALLGLRFCSLFLVLEHISQHGVFCATVSWVLEHARAWTDALLAPPPCGSDAWRAPWRLRL